MRSFRRLSQTMAASSRQLINLRFLCLLLLIAHAASFVSSNSVIATPEATEGLINGGISETNTNYGAGAADGYITVNVEPAVGDAHLHGNARGLESGTSTVRSRFNFRGTYATPPDTHVDSHHGAASTAPTQEPSNNVGSVSRNLEEQQLRGAPEATGSKNDSAGPPAVQNWTRDDQVQQEQNTSRPEAAYSDSKETGSGESRWGGPNCDARQCVLVEQTSIGLNSMYSVEVINVCSCTVCHLHAYCPGFISTVAINPKVFVRLPGSPDNCRVNNGYPIPPGGAIRFTYGGTFQTVIQPSTSASCFSKRRPRSPPPPR